MSADVSLVLSLARRLRARATRLAFAQWSLRALFYGALIAAAALFFAPAVPLVAVAAVVVLLALALGALGAQLARPDLARAAKAGDDAAGLKDRLSSAIELAGEDGSMVRALAAEAAATSRTIEPARVYPWRTPREGWLMPLPLALVALAILLPSWRSAQAAAQPEVRSILDARVKQLNAFAAKQKERPLTPEGQKVLAEVEKIAAELSRNDLTKKDALEKIAQLAQSMQDEKKDLDEKKLDLEKLLKTAKKNDVSRDLAEEVNKGQYSDAAARLAELIDKQKEQIKKLKEPPVDQKKLDAAEEELQNLEELKAKLMKLLKVQFDIDVHSKVLEFLNAMEGELGELPDEKVLDARFLKLGQCNSDCKPKDLVKIRDRCLCKKNKAGKATMEDFFSDPDRHEGTLEEHKQQIHENKGSSAFTQTQVANDGSRSNLSEKEVLAAERHAAEDTIQRQEIPAGYRDYIRRYFDGLQPERTSSTSPEGGK